MKIFVFEHLCSGCASEDDISPQLTPMGSAMLSAVVEDFVATGSQVVTMLDHRINLPLPGAQVTQISSSSQCVRVFEELSDAADVSLIIAPESDGILEGWISQLEERGCKMVNGNLAATRLCADKHLLATTLEDAGIRTPATRVLRGQAISSMSKFPVVIKPRRGAGCEWTFVCHDQKDIEAIPQWEDWIIQPLISGVAASCSVLVNEGHVTPLIAGMQIIEGNKRLHYRGGRLPLNSLTALDLATRAVKAIPGLNGYVGVDMILGNDPAGSEDFVIEVNPRISMSYLGLRVLCEQNLAAALLGQIDAASLTWRPGMIRFNSQGKIVWETGQ